MSDESQIPIPPSFIALFVPPGRLRPTASREEIAGRYELCEDLATALTDRARSLLWELQVTEEDVLLRVRRGLADGPVSPAEADWIVTRLAELMGWPALPAPGEG